MAGEERPQEQVRLVAVLQTRRPGRLHAQNELQGQVTSLKARTRCFDSARENGSLVCGRLGAKAREHAHVSSKGAQEIRRRSALGRPDALERSGKPGIDLLALTWLR